MDDVTNRLFNYFDFNLWICMQRQYSRAPDCNACSITTVFPLLFLVLALLTFCLLDLLNNLIFFCYVSKKKTLIKIMEGTKGAFYGRTQMSTNSFVSALSSHA